MVNDGESCGKMVAVRRELKLREAKLSFRISWKGDSEEWAWG